MLFTTPAGLGIQVSPAPKRARRQRTPAEVRDARGRFALGLVRLEGWSGADLAALFNCSEAAVYSDMKRCRDGQTLGAASGAQDEAPSTD